MTTRILDEGECERCGTECTREPGGQWYNFYGRDQCKLDPDEGPHIVRTWHPLELEVAPALPQIEVVFYGRDASGQDVILAAQQLPSSPGAGFSEQFPDPIEVTGWDIRIRQPGGG